MQASRKAQAPPPSLSLAWPRPPDHVTVTHDGVPQRPRPDRGPARRHKLGLRACAVRSRSSRYGAPDIAETSDNAIHLYTAFAQPRPKQ